MKQKNQLDLFVALAGDIPFRDEREAMTAPLVSLSKNKRNLIEWQGPSGQNVTVTAPEKYGVATIWDYDLILWSISQINEAINSNLDTSPRIFFHPYDMLKATGRNTGGKGYTELKAAMRRLQSTSISYESISPRPLLSHCAKSVHILYFSIYQYYKYNLNTSRNVKKSHALAFMQKTLGFENIS